MARAAALPGDVVMNIVGPPLGKVAILTDQYPEWSINQALTLFRPGKRVTGGWLYVFLCSGASVRDVLAETRGTAGQVNISLTQCRNFWIPVPSVEEQEEIVHRVAPMLDAADKLHERIRAVVRRVGRTSKAVLATAFRGDLTTGRAHAS
jgi:type I restriction enzyme S subunit